MRSFFHGQDSKRDHPYVIFGINNRCCAARQDVDNIEQIARDKDKIRTDKAHLRKDDEEQDGMSDIVTKQVTTYIPVRSSNYFLSLD